MKHHVERVLPYGPDQLFQLVGDVGRYPEFVPWVTAMEVGAPRDLGEGVTTVDAVAGVGFSFLTERFATRVRRDPAARTIEVELIRGPFRHLQNRWRFVPHPQGATVVFDIDFAFKARLLDTLLKANFDRAVGRLIGCFEARAREIYGPRPARPEAAPAPFPEPS